MCLPEGDFGHRVYIIDDGSTDGTGDSVRAEFGECVTVLDGDGELFWTGAINMGVVRAIEDGCDYVHCMNDDVEFEEEFLIRLYNVATMRQGSIVSSITCDTSLREVVVRGGLVFSGIGWREIGNVTIGELRKTGPYTVDAVSGRSVLIPREVFEHIGLFDALRFPHSFADFDFFFRATKDGFRSIINPESVIFTTIEPMPLARMVSRKRIDSVVDLWLNRRCMGLITLWHLSRCAPWPNLFFARQFIRKVRLTALRLSWSEAALEAKIVSTKERITAL